MILNKEKHIGRMELVPSFLYCRKGTKNEKRIEEKQNIYVLSSN